MNEVARDQHEKTGKFVRANNLQGQITESQQKDYFESNFLQSLRPNQSSLGHVSMGSSRV